MKQYHDLLQYVLDNGTEKPDRTGTGIKSVFGYQMRFDLQQGFPLYTTKKVHFPSIVKELLWFINGSTNARELESQGVRIWSEWQDKNTGDLGPIYGKQWTAWPTKDGSTVNQIQYVVDMLKNNPTSRRILFHGWNVEYLPFEHLSPQENVSLGRMALPPCHLLYQFNVVNNKLSLMLTIRSNDLFLGNPFNVAQAALWVHILAQQCNLEVGDLVISIGDAHIYSNHYEQVNLQLSREPKSLPQLKINRKPDSVFDYIFEDFEILDYNPHPHIPGKVAV